MIVGYLEGVLMLIKLFDGLSLAQILKYYVEADRKFEPSFRMKAHSLLR